MAAPTWSVDAEIDYISVGIDNANGWKYFKYGLRDENNNELEVTEYTTSKYHEFTGLSRGTVYKVYVSWSSSTVGEGNYDYTTIKTWVMTKWSWASSNGKATSAQTRLARDAINNQGSISDFSYLVWNDLVEKINEAVCEYGYDWVNHPLRFNKTKMTSTDKTLTADRFNSARYNVGLYQSTGIDDVSKGDKVYGSYFKTITTSLNEWINDMNSV